nr:unnamed protein product [Callosobruchus analis]
MQLLKKNST